MKVLYLILLYNGEINGGHTYRMATVKALKKIVGEGNLDIVLSELDTSDWGCNVALRLKSYDSGIDKLKNLISGNITQRSNEDIKGIIDLINKNNYDLVILGSSETGKLIYEIKKHCRNIKTITWYHDIVADVIARKIKREFNIIKMPIWLMQRYSEKIDAKMTDLPIVLHKRDAGLLKKYWGRETHTYIPIALDDKYVSEGQNNIPNENNTLNLLFVGAYNWNVNIEAAYWFCENVMTKLLDYDVVFNIAGFGMEKLLEDGVICNYSNVRVLGTVADLSETYRSADVVVEPIITGSGMKVKTAEALMHGKEIIGTEEALVGYDELKDYICYDDNDFVERIKSYCENRPAKFNAKNRQSYEENYSIVAIENKLRDALELVAGF